MSTPLFDHVFKTGESKISCSLARKRAIRSQPVSPSRRSDPQTSVEAANANQEIRGEQRKKVFGYLLSVGANGATDYEIGSALNILRTSAGKRRHELVSLGYVVDSGTRRKTDGNVSAIVWRVK